MTPQRISSGQAWHVITGGGVEVMPDVSPQACPKLAPDEVGCDGKHHEVGERTKTSRRCPLRAYKAERERLAEALALCGYGRARDALAFPVAEELAKSIDYSRPLSGLLDVAPALAELRRAGWGQGPHAVLWGTMGTVKTHAAFVVYFGALWDAADALWIGSRDLANVGQDLASFDEIARAKARARLEGWKRRALLCIDDVGDYVSQPGATTEGSTRSASALGELLNGSSRQRIVTSNLGREEMRRHPDIGERNADRLFADRIVDCGACGGRGHEVHGGNQTIPCLKCSGGTLKFRAIEVELDGPSQRRAADNLGR